MQSELVQLLSLSVSAPDDSLCAGQEMCTIRETETRGFCSSLGARFNKTGSWFPREAGWPVINGLNPAAIGFPSRGLGGKWQILS
jgi:hypothetical protein